MLPQEPTTHLYHISSLVMLVVFMFDLHNINMHYFAF